MSPLVITLYALHVIAAIVWFGGGLTSVLVTGPAIGRLSPGAASEVGPAIGMFAQRLYPKAAMLTIACGVLLAILNGRITGLDDLHTLYGATVALALVLAGGVYVFGQRVIHPAAAAIHSAPQERRAAATAKLIKLIASEQLGFLGVFACMVLMRFGL